MTTESKERPIELDRHPRCDDLSRLVRIVALTAADEQRRRLADGLDELMADGGLDIDDGVVGSVNVIKALQRAEPPVLAGRELLALLLARGVGLEPPADAAGDEHLAKALCWLAANTYIDALSVLDDALDSELADRVWTALGQLVRDADQKGTPAGRAEALVAVAAMTHAVSASARSIGQALVSELNDPMLRSMADRPPAVDDVIQAPTPPSGADTSVCGQLISPPLGPVRLVLWTVSGLIVIRYLLRFVGKVVLRLERPAEVKVGASGVTLAAKLAVVGRTVRENQTHIPLANLAVAAIEVRYPRLALYAGLLALAIGTFVGVSLVTDGGRAGSPSLLALGAIVFGIGVVCDLVFASLWPSRRGKYQLVLVPRKGRTIALSTTEQGAATAALRRLTRSAP